MTDALGSRMRRHGGVIAFAVLGVLAFAVLFYAGRNGTFYGDEWSFVGIEGIGTIDDWMRPWGAHWVMVPMILWRSVFTVVGLGSYLPYLAILLVLHILAATALVHARSSRQRRPRRALRRRRVPLPGKRLSEPLLGLPVRVRHLDRRRTVGARRVRARRSTGFVRRGGAAPRLRGIVGHGCPVHRRGRRRAARRSPPAPRHRLAASRRARVRALVPRVRPGGGVRHRGGSSGHLHERVQVRVGGAGSRQPDTGRHLLRRGCSTACAPSRAAASPASPKVPSRRLPPSSAMRSRPTRAVRARVRVAGRCRGRGRSTDQVAPKGCGQAPRGGKQVVGRRRGADEDCARRRRARAPARTSCMHWVQASTRAIGGPRSSETTSGLRMLRQLRPTSCRGTRMTRLDQVSAIGLPHREQGDVALAAGQADREPAAGRDPCCRRSRTTRSR